MVKHVFSTWLNKLIYKWKGFLELTGAIKIIRRYAIMNAFDGALTTFGILVANFYAGTQNPGIVFFLGMSTGIAMAISGVWGTFFIERAEQKKELKRIERNLLRPIGNTNMAQAYSFSSVITAIVDGIAPIMTAFFILIPFLLTPLIITSVELAYYISFALSVIVFFSLGTMMGKIARENPWIYGIRFMLAGMVALLLLYLFNNLPGGLESSQGSDFH